MKKGKFNKKNLLRIFSWTLLASLFPVGFYLGFVGFEKQHKALSEHYSTFDLVYLTLRTFSLEAEVSGEEIGWELQIARFLNPSLTMFLGLGALFEIFYVQAQTFFLRFRSKHSIVCGLGRIGLRLVRQLHDQGKYVVVIEHDENNDNLDACKELGVPVLKGSAIDGYLFKKANIEKADRLFVVCGDDGTNMKIAFQAFKLFENNIVRKDEITCMIHLLNRDLRAMMEKHPIRSNENDRFKLEFFNVMETGIRALLNEYPLFDFEKEKNAWDSPNTAPHFFIIGLGSMGENLLVRLVKDWGFVVDASSSLRGRKMHITVVDKNIELKKSLLNRRYPELQRYCELDFKEIEIKSPELIEKDIFFKENKPSVSRIYICLNDEFFGVSLASSCHRILQEQEHGKKTLIVVRMMEGSALAAFLKEYYSDIDEFSIKGFDLLSKACEDMDLLSKQGDKEVLARAGHESYLLLQLETGEKMKSGTAMVPWDNLPDDYKEDNRQQAVHFAKRLEESGYRISYSSHWESIEELPPELIEKLAITEHERWCENKKKQGYVYGKNKNIDPAKGALTNPSLVTWDMLEEKTKTDNRRTVERLPHTLAKANRKIEKVWSRS